MAALPPIPPYHEEYSQRFNPPHEYSPLLGHPSDDTLSNTSPPPSYSSRGYKYTGECGSRNNSGDSSGDSPSGGAHSQTYQYPREYDSRNGSGEGSGDGPDGGQCCLILLVILLLGGFTLYNSGVLKGLTPEPGPEPILQNGRQYQIVDVSSGGLLTTINGHAYISPADEIGVINSCWTYVEHKGGQGFYSSSAGCFLGHDAHNNIVCRAGSMRGWERFLAFERYDARFVLMLSHYKDLWGVAVNGNGNGVFKSLAMRKPDSSQDTMANYVTWQFIRNS